MEDIGVSELIYEENNYAFGSESSDGIRRGFLISCEKAITSDERNKIIVLMQRKNNGNKNQGLFYSGRLLHGL
jgi:hypothetical protein